MRFLVLAVVTFMGSYPLSLFATERALVELSFKHEAPASQSTVRLGDIAVVRSEDAAAAKLANAVEIALQSGPGQFAVITRQDVVSAIAKNNSALLGRLRWNGRDRVKVGKLGDWLVDSESVANAEQALQLWLGDRTKSYELQQRGTVESKWLERGAKVQYIVAAGSKIRRQMPVQVEITDVTGKSRSFPIWFSVSALQDVWTLARDVDAGELIAASDLLLQTVDVTALVGEFFPVDLLPIDQMMIVPAKSGVVLLKSLIKRRADVMVGETVTVKLSGPMIQLETTGLALQSAEKGSRVLVRNARSGETLVARVSGRNVVEVGP